MLKETETEETIVFFVTQMLKETETEETIVFFVTLLS